MDASRRGVATPRLHFSHFRQSMLRRSISSTITVRTPRSWSGQAVHLSLKTIAGSPRRTRLVGCINAVVKSAVRGIVGERRRPESIASEEAEAPVNQPDQMDPEVLRQSLLRELLIGTLLLLFDGIIERNARRRHFERAELPLYKHCVLEEQVRGLHDGFFGVGASWSNERILALKEAHQGCSEDRCRSGDAKGQKQVNWVVSLGFCALIGVEPGSADERTRRQT